MNALLKVNQRAFQFALASTLALGASTMSGDSVAATSSTVTVGATLVAACEVTPTATISFGPIANLFSSGDQTANSVATFKVACSNDASPSLYTADAHVMVGPGSEHLPFNLSLANSGADDFPTAAGTSLSLVQDGTLKTVALYAKVFAADFTGSNARTSGAYTVNLTVSVDY
jgi:spore coat protein U-like protein